MQAKNSSPKILFIGSLVADVIALMHDPKKMEIEEGDRTERLVCIAFASKTELGGLTLKPGGSAANSAIAAHKLGAKSALVSAVGNDLFGKMLVGNLRGHGIDAAGVEVKAGEKSGMSIVLLSAGEKSVLNFPGAVGKLSAKNVNRKMISKNDAIVLTSLATKSSFSLFLKAIGLAKKLGRKIIFAPSISMLRDRRKELSAMHGHFDACVMNREEAEFYSGRRGAGNAIRHIPGKVRVVTDASNGSYLYEGGRIFHISVPQTPVRDTTGAGDTFTGAFTRELLTSGNPRHALRTGTAAAAIKLRHVGAHLTHGLADVRKFERKHAKELAVREMG
ncbi:carbohydrate kinase family protein [Candidatus Micrarchaeota archaeon]|nr:carbohydrate kinase family protein [Candidatus Micrarchaeota archaeon]